MSDPEADQPVEQVVDIEEEGANDTNNNESDVGTVKQADREQPESHERWAKVTGYSPGHVTPDNYGSFIDGAQSPNSYDGSDGADGPNGARTLTGALRARLLRARTRVNTTDWIALRTGMRPSRRA